MEMAEGNGGKIKKWWVWRNGNRDSNLVGAKNKEVPPPL